MAYFSSIEFCTQVENPLQQSQGLLVQTAVHTGLLHGDKAAGGTMATHAWPPKSLHGCQPCALSLPNTTHRVQQNHPRMEPIEGMPH